MLCGYTHSFLFFSNLAEKNLLIVKKFSKCPKMASLVYERENCFSDLEEGNLYNFLGVGETRKDDVAGVGS